MSAYDTWLLNQADYYTAPCEPEKDAEGEFTKCIECLDKCDVWLEMQEGE